MAPTVSSSPNGPMAGFVAGFDCPQGRTYQAANSLLSTVPGEQSLKAPSLGLPGTGLAPRPSTEPGKPRESGFSAWREPVSSLAHQYIPPSILANITTKQWDPLWTPTAYSESQPRFQTISKLLNMVYKDTIAQHI